MRACPAPVCPRSAPTRIPGPWPTTADSQAPNPRHDCAAIANRSIEYPETPLPTYATPTMGPGRPASWSATATADGVPVLLPAHRLPPVFPQHRSDFLLHRIE